MLAYFVETWFTHYHYKKTFSLLKSCHDNGDDDDNDDDGIQEFVARYIHQISPNFESPQFHR